MNIKAKDLAALLSGRVHGDENYEVCEVRGIREAGPRSVSFLSHPGFRKWLPKSKAGIIVASHNLDLEFSTATAIIRVADINLAKNQLINVFKKDNAIQWAISKLASIHPTVEIGKPVHIGDFVVIKSNCKIAKNCVIHDQVFIGEGVQLGDSCTIHPGVRIHSGTVIGNRVIIRSNAVIGSEGFGYTRNEEGRYQKVFHLGNVVIEDDVEIGCNTVIDRATLDSTLIGKGVKLDNLIQVAHNVVINKNTVIAAQTGIAGSATVGSNSIIGGQVGVAGHITLEDGIQIQAKSGISKSISEKHSRWYGYPALKYFDYLRSYAVFKRLPEIVRELNILKKDVNKLKDRAKNRDI